MRNYDHYSIQMGKMGNFPQLNFVPSSYGIGKATKCNTVKISVLSSALRLRYLAP